MISWKAKNEVKLRTNELREKTDEYFVGCIWTELMYERIKRMIRKDYYEVFE